MNRSAKYSWIIVLVLAWPQVQGMRIRRQLEPDLELPLLGQDLDYDDHSYSLEFAAAINAPAPLKPTEATNSSTIHLVQHEQHETAPDDEPLDLEPAVTTHRSTIHLDASVPEELLEPGVNNHESTVHLASHERDEFIDPELERLELQGLINDIEDAQRVIDRAFKSYFKILRKRLVRQHQEVRIETINYAIGENVTTSVESHVQSNETTDRETEFETASFEPTSSSSAITTESVPGSSSTSTSTTESSSENSESSSSVSASFKSSSTREVNVTETNGASARKPTYVLKLVEVDEDVE